MTTQETAFINNYRVSAETHKAKCEINGSDAMNQWSYDIMEQDTWVDIWQDVNGELPEDYEIPDNVQVEMDKIELELFGATIV